MAAMGLLAFLVVVAIVVVLVAAAFGRIPWTSAGIAVVALLVLLAIMGALPGLELR